ncbi:MAG: beta-ketoacyl-ACP synthase 3, partial [Myxococcales bacterium]|nr:beta-ketoacyl-ACP synthase 3 [Myxococcales bacterium]
SGIERRRIAPPGVHTSALATAAARQALDAAGLPATAIDFIVVATVTGDHPVPATAALVQHALGARCPGVDLNAACAGFLFALAFARGQIACGAARHVLVIGAEVTSRFVDPNDRGVMPLFGDGAGAVVLSAASEAEPGLLALRLGGDGAQADVLRIEAGGAAHPASAETLARGAHTLRMEGPRVFRNAVRHLPEAVRAVCAEIGWSVSDIDWFVPHQANARILRAVVRRLGLAGERLLCNIAEYGNTSAASIPIALDEAARDGRLKPGQRVVLAALGAGLVWGAAAMRWAAPDAGRAVGNARHG